MNFFTVDKHGRITFVNLNDPDHYDGMVPGRILWDIYPGDDGTSFHQACQHVLHDQHPLMLQTLEDGGVWWEKCIYPMADGLAIYTHDISRNKQLEEQQLQGQRIIRRLNLVVLRSVTNLQFVLAALTSIQHYVIRQDVKRAVHYLASFSKLIRQVLGSVISGKTRLADELELIRHYVKLERMRSGHIFSFHINVSPGTNMNREIPAMIVQPFVERTILHGFDGRTPEDPGKLTVTFTDEHDHVSITLEDNGVTDDRTPEADIIITEQRLQLMHAEGILVNTTPLMENGERSGTRVRLAIPYEPVNHDRRLVDD